MKLYRQGSKRKVGTILFNELNTTISINSEKITLCSFGNSDPNSESTYDYMIELTFEDFIKILEKLDDSFEKTPSLIEEKLGEHTKTLFRLLVHSTGLLNEKDEKESVENK